MKMNSLHSSLRPMARRARDIASLLALWALLPAHALADQALYAEALDNGWMNWSWASVNLASTAVAHGGSRSIQVTIVAPWDGLYFAHDPLDASAFTDLALWIHGGTAGGQRLVVRGLLGGKETSSSVPLDPLPANAWKQITIPLASLGVANAANLTGFYVMDAVGKSQPAFHVDDVRLVQGGGTSQPPDPTPTPSGVDLFAEALDNGWMNWSWASVNLASTAVAHGGSRSIQVTIVAPWDGLYFAHDPLDASAFTDLAFWIHGGTAGGQRLVVRGLLGGKETSSSVPLDPLPANAWKQITIPLASLGVANAANLTGFYIMDAVGKSQPAFHVDDVRLLGAGTPGGGTTRAPVAITVDAARNRHPIDARIYGTSSENAEDMAVLHAPLNRWGGNNTTRYNWMLNAINTDFDYFFQSHPAGNGALPGAAVDAFIARSLAHGSQPMITLPMLGWVAKLGPNREVLWSYSVAKYGPQKLTDIWHPDSGNGRRASDGSRILTNDPLDASVPVDSDFQAAWVRHLTNRWGTAGHGGVRYYILDNEPSIWHGTHFDVQRRGVTMDDVRDRTLGLAEKVKAIDPQALIVGPEEWGWLGLHYSGADQQYAAERDDWTRFPDREAHGNMDFLPWYLDQARRRSETVGRRLLDVVTTHFYPAGLSKDDVSESAQLLRNRSTRALWDTNYLDESWVNARIGLLPRLKAWVQAYYPGTQIGITEYNWGWAEHHMNAATAQADVLGIYGREGLDLATRWATPTNTSPTFKAMLLYRNYDGQKSTFGDTSVFASVPNPDHVAAFAAERASDGALTVIVINKQLRTESELSLSVSNFAHRGSAEHWQLKDATGIRRTADVPVDQGVLATTLPPQSISLFVLPASAQRPAIRILGHSAAGGTRLAVGGQSGRTYAIEASSDLAAWSEVGRLTLNAAEGIATIPGNASGHRFFRVGLAP